MLNNKKINRIDLMSLFIHEINQPLTAIIAYSQCCLLLINNKQDHTEILPPLEHIARQAMHAADTIQVMSAFIHDGDIEVQETDINALVEECVSMLNADLLDFKLNIVLNLAAEIPILFVNKLHIMRVILNLARNSIESLQTSPRSQSQLSINTCLVNDHLVICVIDNGPGIPLDYKNKILEPYFTTKPHGTGIGLGVCQLLIETHGGELTVKDNEGKGAWFSFTLPLNRLPQ